MRIFKVIFLAQLLGFLSFPSVYSVSKQDLLDTLDDTGEIMVNLKNAETYLNKAVKACTALTTEVEQTITTKGGAANIKDVDKVAEDANLEIIIDECAKLGIA